MQIAEQTIDVDSVPDDWESLTSAGIDIRAKQDVQRWALGDLAIRVDKRYGQGSLKKFATDIRMPSHKTLYDYALTSRYYSKVCRAEYLERFPLLSWSHYRSAAHAVDLDAALHYLEMANDQDMPVAAMVEAMKLDLGNPVVKRETFEAAYHSGAFNVELLHAADWTAIENVTAQHNCTVQVVVSWTVTTPGA